MKQQLLFTVALSTTQDPTRRASNLENSEVVTSGWQSLGFVYFFIRIIVFN